MKFYLYTICLFILACETKPDLPDAHQAGWQGKTVSKILFEDDTMRVLECTFPPGVGHEKHYHEPHFGYTVKGSTFKIVDEKGTRIINVHSGTQFNKKDVYIHEVLNVGDSTAVFLIYEPKKF